MLSSFERCFGREGGKSFITVRQSVSLLAELISLWHATVHTEVGIYSRHVTSIVNPPFLKAGLPPVVSFHGVPSIFLYRMV